MTTKLPKISKRVAIILLIAVFSIAGIISCSADTPTQPNASQENTVVIPEPGDTGPITPGDSNTDSGTEAPNPDDNPDTDNPGTDPTDPDNPGTPPEPPKPTFPENTYYRIYAPWVKWDESQAPNGWRTNVSYEDTNTLSQIFRQQIEGGKYNDGKRWFIRDANNNNNDHRVGRNAHYYYFDKGLNLVYYRDGRGSLTVRKFITGLIVKYRGGRNDGTYSIGGLYETILTKNEITDNGWDSLNIFMGANHMGERNKGCLAVLMMNTGFDDIYQNEFGIDHYYATRGGEEAWYNIEEYTSRTPDELDSFLNEKGNLSWKLGYVNFRFVFNRPYEWHLTDHLSQQGWH